MTNKPKIGPNLSTTDKAVELIGWIVVLGIWILPLIIALIFVSIA